MERRYPLVPLDLDLAGVLLSDLPSSPCELELLSGGHINTNYLVKLKSGRPVVLRICANGEAAFRKEVKVLQKLAGALPVPEVYQFSFQPDLFAYPYMVFEWVEGVPLPEALKRDEANASTIGSVVGKTLSQLMNYQFPEYTVMDFVPYIKECIFEKGAKQWLGENTSSRLWTFVQQKASLLEEVHNTDSLVHGDFQGDNILLSDRDGSWKVAAILDWEWAHNGCYLLDLGSLLRHEISYSDDFQSGLETGFSQSGRTLPVNWKKRARIIDLVAHCEKLAYPKHRGEVTDRSIAIIERCLQDYES